MLTRKLVLPGIVLSILLLFTATLFYPGGSLVNKTTVGFDWENNYISNLFGEKAVNGSYNSARFWAVAGMFCLSASYALFFAEFSRKIPSKGASKVIKYGGILSMLFTFLIATPLHDLMVIIASTIFLLSLFYITVFVFRSGLHVFKVLCPLCLLVFYATLFLYGSPEHRGILPAMQKITFAFTVILVLCLEYFTTKEDFQHINAGSNKNPDKTAGR
ncbi:MAG: hypothetical protein V4543_14860 [Bacteroidota bacterium]